MRFATYRGKGARQVGIVDPGTAEIRPLALAPAKAERGVLAVVERMVRGAPLPEIGA